ncbi:MAG: DUF1176 domain-containing protein [Pseudorhodoplanes sp.]
MKKMSVAALVLAASAAQASDFKQFRDWYAACDNLRNCSAYGFDAELLGRGMSYLRLERGGAPDAPVKVTITVDVPKGATFTLRFDDASLPGLPAEPQTGEEYDGSDDGRRITIPGSDALLESLRKAKKIVITLGNPPDGALKNDEKVSTISMSGAAAALLWIDDQQKRVDTVTALVRRGPKPASAVPPQPRAPVIVAARPAPGAKAPKPTGDLLAKARKICEGDTRAKLEDADPLAPGLFLYSYSCPDMSGAYNFNSVYFIVPAGQPQAARAVSFLWPVKIGDTVQDSSKELATNASFDPKTVTLHIWNKGRGLGDCGTNEDWVFDGKSFRLAELRMMSECKGALSEDWPVLYRAEVKR